MSICIEKIRDCSRIADMELRLVHCKSRCVVRYRGFSIPIYFQTRFRPNVSFLKKLNGSRCIVIDFQLPPIGSIRTSVFEISIMQTFFGKKNLTNYEIVLTSRPLNVTIPPLILCKHLPVLMVSATFPGSENIFKLHCIIFA